MAEPTVDLRAWLTERGLSETDLAVDARGTITRPVARRAQLTPSRLPLIIDEQRAEAGEIAELRLGGVTAEGGMGVVRTATQLSLGRKVAVKLPRSDDAGEGALALLGEALVAGALEHPNIVPIHALGRDKRGQPLLVMKYLEGEPWSSELLLPDRLERLSHHLGVLMQVCNAVHYAHCQGIVHRDLKPSNIMIGRFGEVHLLDWGLAVALREELAGSLPLARDIADIEGTPSYLAPEMALADAACIGVRTDVYLLGGLLHFVLAGRPPHDAEQLIDRLQQAVDARCPSFDADVPRELGAICQRALARDPTRRFGSAEELRAALAEYLQHQASREVGRAAWQRLSEIERLGAVPEQPRGQQRLAVESIGRQARIRETVIEARFGFREALRSWPGNPDARIGLQRTLELAASFEIAQGNAAAARELLAALPIANAALAERLQELDLRLAREHERVVALEQFERDADFAANRRSRIVSWTLLSALAVAGVLGLTVARLFFHHRTGYLDVAAMYGIANVIVWIANARLAPPANRANARARLLGYALLAGAIPTLALGWWLGLDLTRGLALLLWVYAAVSLATGYLMSALFFPAAAVFAVAAIAMVAFAPLRPLWSLIGFGGGAALILRANLLLARTS